MIGDGNDRKGKVDHCWHLQIFRQIILAQCGNSSNLLPLRYYVKSILADFEASKTAILTVPETVEFEF